MNELLRVERTGMNETLSLIGQSVFIAISRHRVILCLRVNETSTGPTSTVDIVILLTIHSYNVSISTIGLVERVKLNFVRVLALE